MKLSPSAAPTSAEACYKPRLSHLERRHGADAYDRPVILRCTRKLLTVIGPKLVAEPAPAPDAEDWYANLLWFDRRKCLLMTHSATLFTIFEPNVNAPELRATDHLVTRLIGRELLSEGLPLDAFSDRSRRTSSWPGRLTAVSWGA